MGMLNMIILMIIMTMLMVIYLLQIGSHELLGVGELGGQFQLSLLLSPDEEQVVVYENYSSSFRFKACPNLTNEEITKFTTSKNLLKLPIWTFCTFTFFQTLPLSLSTYSQQSF